MEDSKLLSPLWCVTLKHEKRPTVQFSSVHSTINAANEIARNIVETLPWKDFVEVKDESGAPYRAFCIYECGNNSLSVAVEPPSLPLMSLGLIKRSLQLMNVFAEGSADDLKARLQTVLSDHARHREAVISSDAGLRRSSIGGSVNMIKCLSLKDTPAGSGNFSHDMEAGDTGMEVERGTKRSRTSLPDEVEAMVIDTCGVNFGSPEKKKGRRAGLGFR